MPGPANIDSPEVLLELKRGLIALMEGTSRCITNGVSDIARVQHWLQQERLPDVKRQHRTWEQRASEARIRLLAAKSMNPQTGRNAGLGRTSFEDEERDFKRAKAAYEATEDKLRHINNALAELPRLTDTPSAVCKRTQRHMEDTTPRALAQLDRMIEGLENYGGTQGGSE